MLETRVAVACLVLFQTLCTHGYSESAIRENLAEVRQLHQQTAYSAAEEKLRLLSSKTPGNQKVALYLGLNLYYQDKYTDAARELSRAISIKPGNWDAQQATFLLAKVQGLAGKRNEALETIAQMKAESPDSWWLPQAWIVEAELTGGNVQEATDKLAQQNQGEKEYKEILALKGENKETAQLDSLTSLATSYKGLPVELTARESIAHLLTLTSGTREAIAAFQSIIYDLRDSAPNSRIVVTATSRMAALYHRLGDRPSALSYYEETLKTSKNNKLSENAVLKSAGIAFEILQHDTMNGESISRERWEDTRRMIQAGRHNDHSTHTQIISLLMEIESYQWSGDYDKAVEYGHSMMEMYGHMHPQFRRELATAHLVLSRIAKERKNYSQSIIHSTAALEMYPVEDFIWPKMDHLQRAYYDLVESLYSTGQTVAANNKLREFTKRFPTSTYIEMIESSSNAGLYARRSSSSKGGQL